MSRTYRKTDGMHRYAYRFPHTFNEIRSLDGILNDDELQDYPVSGLNHMRSRESNLPTAWDDNIVSSYREQYYK